ncbi:serpin family protein [Demequina sp. SYSU T00192]|uniref:Serpin family protein n=1 Tax=Demequina litoralis TaxID=3051660 RepID=A0ABT8G9Y5_9MICO|nr:serpin family protein [Demequina sp. SYSU T00192]MDN4475936.1 serpin family protein [Demequina sp. SYSU T00192]
MTAPATSVPVPDPAPTFDRPAPTPAAAVPLAASLNETGLSIFRVAAGDENLALSPVSIGLAFGMVGAGASGPVDAALDELFAYPAEGESLLSAFNSLGLTVASEAGEGGLTTDGEPVDLPIVRIASSAWFEDTFTPDPGYVDTVRTWFGAETQSLPLLEDPAGSREVIDGWVKDRTAGLIPRVMPQSIPNEDTRFILVNTVYLKAQWWAPFFEAGTHPERFTLLDGGRATVDLMAVGADVDYVQAEGYDAAVLPYVGDLEMTLVVPHEGEFVAVRDGLDGVALAALDDARAPGHVYVRMPRFASESSVDLREVIGTGMGVDGLFGTIGLDGIGPELEVGAAVHATKVIVDEDGTEAAAATVVEGAAGAAPPEFDAEIIADRPFLYVIRDTTSDAILFVGQYVDPDGG